ncbi:MAG TPA: cadherin repeat domain-containing protein [Cellvibrionaceae bacterium]|nr:cadherin repeat domain-containing protein [Cellvibrionaceae bacterium]
MKLPVQVTGVGPFKYQFIFSADASLFNLNETTGELTNKNTFDFEKPQSEKGTNQYTLLLLVTDANKRSVTQDIVIDVQNVDEYELVVDFPIDGANMGMGANKVRVRGHITESGKTLAQIPPALSVSVNGVAAVVDPAAPSRWMAEIPLVPGDNSMAVILTNGGKDEAETKLNLANYPVGSRRVADGVHDFYLMTDYTASKIYKKSFSDENKFSVVVSNSVEPFTSCQSFTGLALSKSATQVSAMCFTNDSDVQKVIVCDLTDHTCGFKGAIDASAELVTWADEGRILYEIPSKGFGLLDTQTGSVKTLLIDNKTFEFNRFSTHFDIDINDVYVNLDSIDTNGIRSYGIFKFDLGRHINESGAEQALSLIQVMPYSNGEGRFFYFENAIYSQSAGAFSVRPLGEPFVGSRSIPDLKAGAIGSINILNETDGVVTLSQDGSVYTYDLRRNKTVPLATPKYFEGRFELDLNPLSGRIALYEPDKRKAAFYDIDSGLVSGVETLPSAPFNTSDIFGGVALDEPNQILYRYNNGNWGGVPPDATPLFSSYNLQTKTFTTIATAGELASQISRSFDRLSPRGMVYKPDTQELIFHLMLYKNPEDPFGNETSEQLICSLKPSTRQVKTIAVFGGRGTLAEIMMSRLNPKTNSLVFGHWGDVDAGGGVELFNLDGTFSKLIEPQAPYYTTARGIWNSIGDRYYGLGFKYVNNSGYLDTSQGELFFIDVAAQNGIQTGTTLASKSQGYGLAPPYFEPMYDARRDILLGFAYNHFWIVDAITGDRVIKPLLFPTK